MANLKMKNKRLLEKLQAKITLKIERKMSQQDILDKCIEFTYRRLDEFIEENIKHPPIKEDLINRLKKTSIDEPYLILISLFSLGCSANQLNHGGIAFLYFSINLKKESFHLRY